MRGRFCGTRIIVVGAIMVGQWTGNGWFSLWLWLVFIHGSNCVSQSSSEKLCAIVLRERNGKPLQRLSDANRGSWQVSKASDAQWSDKSILTWKLGRPWARRPRLSSRRSPQLHFRMQVSRATLGASSALAPQCRSSDTPLIEEGYPINLILGV